MHKETRLAVFQGKNIRKVIYNNEWWFSIIDVIEALTDASIPRRYWSDLKIKLKNEGYSQLYENIVQLKLVSADGKMYNTDCANTKTLFRLIQSIPSPKAEPFKQWLSEVGYERIKEIENPELAMHRMQELYEKKGYPKEWIEKRIRGIAVRQSLTKEWDNRGAEKDLDYAILTNEIIEGAFGLKVEDYKKVKGLERQNLRDHMNDIELILTMLGEATTTKLTKDRDSKGMPRLRKDAQEGGTVAGNTRKEIEMRSGKPVVSDENYLGISKKKLLRRK